MPTTPVAKPKDLTRRYIEWSAGDGIGFVLGRGEVFGILRLNGAAKRAALSPRPKALLLATKT
jgi:ABC-type Na+ transport system ATPase subunit NatA